MQKGWRNKHLAFYHFLEFSFLKGTKIENLHVKKLTEFLQ